MTWVLINVWFQIENNVSNFIQIEVVGGGSDTQNQVDEKLIYLILRFKG